MPAPHDPDPLEAAALAWLQQPSAPVPESLAIDADELRLLLLALGHPLDAARPEPPSYVEGQPIRAGYRLVAQVGEDPVVLPVFAQALAAELDSRSLGKLFDHLWGVDLALWRRLGDASHAELARMWLTSPGRRLVRSLDTLTLLREPGEAAHIDAACIAAGDSEGPNFARWRDRHGSIPGEAMAAWAPKRSDRDVPIALARLEHGSPHGLRGAALGWLLGRAADQPQVELDGVRQNLRESLPGYLALALQHDESHEDFGARLEEQALQHAALIAPGSVLRAWHVSRWILGCLVRSPFAPDREELLHAELMARLPPERAPIEPDDPLHPSRFGVEGLRIADLTLVAGTWAHYGRDTEPLMPPPLPLVNALVRLANRELHAAELEAERSLARGLESELGWTAQHVAPPWVARWLLTQWRIDWLTKVEHAVVRECLQALRDDARFDWFAHVVRAEAPMLSDSEQQFALAVWRAIMAAPQPRSEVAASLAIGLQARLEPREHALAFAAIAESPASWQPFLWSAWAEAALAAERMPLALPALDALLTLARESTSSDEVRLNAALLLLRRAAAARGTPERTHFLAELGALTQLPPFRDHTGLMRELRRLGATPASAR